MKVSELMSSPAVATSPSASIRDVAGKMEEYGVGSVVTMEHGSLRGIVTDRDLAVRCLTGSVAPKSPVREVMSTQVIRRWEPWSSPWS
ncbi:CBS domain-containing protein [Streptomyces sp. NPDC002896]|uniref:CBS domain-containing protein n=1 Tax=Streptomyces sp. NPDC002896 TaxID=3154438 RepID=UPI003316A5AC